MKNLKTNPKLKKIIKGGTTLVLVASLINIPTAEAIDTNNFESTTESSIITVQNELKPVELNVSKGVNIYFNGVSCKVTDALGNDVYPFIYNGTTYLPIRAISEMFGFNVRWDGYNNRAYLETNNSEITIKEGNKNPTKPNYLYDEKINAFKGIELYIDEQLFVPKDANGKEVDIYMINGTTYLPVRAISEIFNVIPLWAPFNHSVYLSTIEKTNETIKTDDKELQVAIDAIIETLPTKRAYYYPLWDLSGMINEILFSDEALYYIEVFEKILPYYQGTLPDEIAYYAQKAFDLDFKLQYELRAYLPGGTYVYDDTSVKNFIVQYKEPVESGNLNSLARSWLIFDYEMLDYDIKLNKKVLDEYTYEFLAEIEKEYLYCLEQLRNYFEKEEVKKLIKK